MDLVAELRLCDNRGKCPGPSQDKWLSKAITIQLIGEDSYRLRPYLRTLERAAYTIIASILRSFKVPADRTQP